jgi:hypothetical protein
VQWVRGTVGELIFRPWVEKIRELGREGGREGEREGG